MYDHQQSSTDLSRYKHKSMRFRLVCYCSSTEFILTGTLKVNLTAVFPKEI